MQVSSMQEISTVLAKVMQSDGMDWGSMESVREHVASAFTDLHMIVDICLSVYLSTYLPTSLSLYLYLYPQPG